MRRGRRYAAAFLLAAGVMGASDRSTSGSPLEVVQPANVATAAYDLRADERIGGHTLARHVGKTDAELADRLRREPGISAASTYTDLDTAARVVAAALAESRGKVEIWARRSGPRPNLTVSYQSPGRPVGRSLSRGARVAAVATRALVVLRWHDRQRRWYVLTSYPEARR